MTDQTTTATGNGDGTMGAAIVVPHQDRATDDAFEYEHLAREYDRSVATIAAELRALADRVECYTSPRPNQESPGFVDQASMLVGKITNAIPNLGLPGLMRAASAADSGLLERRLSRSIAENDFLRANPGLTVAQAQPEDQETQA